MPFTGTGLSFTGAREKDAGSGRYGSGEHGAIVVGTTVGYTSNPLTLTEDVHATDFTIPAGYTVFCDGAAVFCTNKLSVAATGVLHADGPAGSGVTAGSWSSTRPRGRGSNGGNGGNNTAGTAGTNIASGALGGSGATGGTAGSAGAAGGTATAGATLVHPRDSLHALIGWSFSHTAGLVLYRGGAGGGGGRSPSSGQTGGGGGAGGGILLVSARHIENNGTIRAHGGVGGNASGTNCGGGGGGGGGAVILLYSFREGSGTYTASGAAGGSGNGTGATGGTGSAGTVYVLGPT